MVGDSTYNWTPKSLQLALGVTGMVPLQDRVVVDSGEDQSLYLSPIFGATLLMSVTLPVLTLYILNKHGL